MHLALKGFMHAYGVDGCETCGSRSGKNARVSVNEGDVVVEVLVLRNHELKASGACFREM